MPALLVALLALPEVGLASMYRPWERSATVPHARYACAWRRLPRPDDHACAHRTAPCGATLRITYRDRSTTCTVLDRRPRACVPAPGHRSRACPDGYRWRAPRHLPAGAWRRGVLDAAPAVWRALGSRGWVRVRVELVR